MAVKKKSDEVKKETVIKPKPKYMYVAIGVDQYHPFEKKKISTALPGVELNPEDTWVIAQVDRGLIKCLQ